MSSSSKELSKFEKEKQKLIQEKCQGLLNEMLRDDDNKYCVDCDAKGPRWASWNLGVFLCIRCAGIHRNLGVHISRVKSVNLDSWTPEQVVTMQQMGNSRARAVYEANLPDNFRRPQTDVALENFIRAKYEHTKYIAQEWVKPPPPRVDWNSEIEEQIRKKKEKKAAGADTVVLPPGKVLGKSTVRSNNKPAEPKSKEIPSPVPPPITASTAAAVVGAPASTSSASDDLLGLVVNDDPFASPVKSTNESDGGTTISNDLGSVFSADAVQQTGKMSKESILSLYGSGGATISNNPFAAGGGGGLFATQQGTFDGSNNGFGGLISGGGTGAHVGLNQLQQGLFSLNLGGTVPPQQQAQVVVPQQFPNSNLFATPQVIPPQSNLNMLMNNTSPFGAFASAPVPPPQQQQQQSMFNQFGVFQNGGSGGSSGQTTAAATSNIDLLWK